MNDDTSARLEKMESNLAHLEHQVEQLNGVIIAQGKLLERMKKEVSRQSSAMESMEQIGRASCRERVYGRV